MSRVPRTAPLLLALALNAAAAAAAAQDPELDAAAAEAITAFYNREGTTRLTGATRIAGGTIVAGDVASLGGPLDVEGAIRGDVVVINGDLRLLPGGAVAGTVIITGGRFLGDSTAVQGFIRIYPQALAFRREDGRILPLEPSRAGWLSAARATSFGRTELLVSVDGAYNRVEGLPISFGPRVELGHSNPTVLAARLTYRTRYGFRVHPDEFGHTLRLEQFMGGHRALALGASLFRRIDPIELRGLSDTENSLSTFVLQRDYRDHYDRRGWSGYLRFVGRTRPYDALIEYRDETHGSVDPGTPWALLGNDEDWRAQPQAAEGELRTLGGRFRWDTRNDRADPSTGWLLEVEAEQGLEGDLRVDVPPLVPGGDPTSTRIGAEYTALRLEARRYLRVGPRTRLALRAVAGGSPDDGPLPPQRQHALGGEGSLPGYDRFELDCGARAFTLSTGYFPYYGCDRALLVQAEVHFAILTGTSLGRSLGLDFDLLATPELVLFGDAGRAWIEPESVGYRNGTGPDDFRYDAGIGLRLGRVGFYLAAPIEAGWDRGVNFFIRVGRRF